MNDSERKAPSCSICNDDGLVFTRHTSKAFGYRYWVAWRCTCDPVMAFGPYYANAEDQRKGNQPKQGARRLDRRIPVFTERYNRSDVCSNDDCFRIEGEERAAGI